MNNKLTQPVQHHLSNGIPVVFLNLPGAVAATYWWNRVGSGDELPHEAGFAHFLEHMLFKDAAAKETGQASSGQTARAIESLGGDINAYTSFDQTVYHVTCAAQHWESVLKVFGPMAKPLRFLKTDFEREREVILEELAKNDDSPGRRLYQNLFAATYQKHPYGRPVIGFERTLKAAKVGELEAFYKRCYVSSNMGLILVGPLDLKRQKSLLVLLEKFYGSSVLPKKAHTRLSRPVEKELRAGVSVKKLPFDVKAPLTAFSFRVPHLLHPDIPALDLSAGVLGMGELSWLYQKLFYQKSLVTDVSGSLFVPKDPGLFYFQLEVESIDRLKLATEGLFEEIRRFKLEGPKAEELDRVVVNLESERLYATQTADGMASRLGFLRFVIGDLNYDRAYLDEIKALDPHQVKTTFGQYMDPQRLGLSLVVSKSDAAYDAEALAQTAVRALTGGVSLSKTGKKGTAKKIVTPTAEEIDALTRGMQPEVITRPSGLRVVFLERPQSHVVSIHASALGGLRLELADPIGKAELDWGVSNLMAQTWTKGAGSGDHYKDANAISAIVEGTASSLEGFAGRNTVGLQLTALARDWDRLSELFSEVLLEPAFTPAELEHSKRIVEDSIRTFEDHTSQVCSKLFLETLFEKHPYGHLPMGSLESVKAISSERIKQFHRRWVRPDRLVLSVVGGIRRSDLERWLDLFEARASRLEDTWTPYTLRAHVPSESILKAPRWVEKSFGREQTHLIIGGLGTTIQSEDRFALRVMQNVLGGQSGRLFIELREKKSLAYSVAPVSFEGLEPGYIGTYIASSTGKQKEAIAGIQQVLGKLAAKGPSSSEVKRAQYYYLGKRAMDLQSDSSLAPHFGLELLYGIPHAGEDEVSERIMAVTAKEVQAVCRKYLVDPHFVTSQVG